HVGQVQQVLPIEIAGFDPGVLQAMQQNSENTEANGTAGPSTNPTTAATNQPSPASASTTTNPAEPPRPLSPIASPHPLTVPPSTCLGGTKQAARGDLPRYILTAALDSTVKLWDLTTNTCVKTLFGHVEGVWALAADTLRVVSGAQDRMVKVWDVRAGR